MGRKAGLTNEKLRAVRGDDMTPFSDIERLVIELANAMADTPSNVSDDLMRVCATNSPRNSCYNGRTDRL